MKIGNNIKWFKGKVRYEDRVYERNDRIMLENDSMSSINDTKDVNNTMDRMNANDSINRNRNQYSTNVP